MNRFPIIAALLFAASGQVWAQQPGNQNLPTAGSGSTNVPVTCASSVTFTMASTFLTDFFLNLNCNVTSSTMAGTLVAGNEATFTLTQDSTGGRTFAWPANFLNVPILNSLAGGSTVATFQYCGTVGNGNACPANSWQNTDVGPAGSQNSAANMNVVYVSPNCGTQTNCFPVLANTQVIYDATTSNASATITCSNNNCNFQCPGGTYPCSSGGDVGKIVWATSLGITSTPPFNPVLNCPQSTIGTVNNAQSITLASGTCANGLSTLVWGSDDTANLTAAWTAVKNSCGALQLPDGRMMIQSAVFINVPTECKHHSANSSKQISITGTRYRGGSEIVPTPTSFNYASCTGPDGTGHACFGWGTLLTPADGGMYFRNWTINAYGPGIITGAPTVDFLYLPADTLIDSFEMTNWGSNSPNTVALHCNGNNIIVINSQIDAAGGSEQVFIDNGVIAASAFINDYIGDTNGDILFMSSGRVKSIGNQWGPSANTTVSGPMFLAGGTFESDNDLMYTYGGGGSGLVSLYCHGVTGRFNYWTTSLVGALGNRFGVGADAGKCYFRDSEVAASVSGLDAVHINSGGTVIDEGGNIFNGTGGNAVNIASGGTFINQGFSTFIGAVTNNGTIIGSGSATGALQTAANITPTSGFGTGCATAGQCISAVSGATQREQFTVTYGTGPSSPQVITVVFPTAFLSTPICRLTDVGGTNAFPTSIVTTTCTTTGASFTITNTPVGGSTDIFQLQADNP